MRVETLTTFKPKQSRIISKVVSPALQLWLRSQVEQVEALNCSIAGGDRQILGGYIPSVSIAASGAVYQGLHLSKIKLEGTNIRFNFSGVLKDKPLCLIESVPVIAWLLLEGRDLQASLSAPLLSTALSELLAKLLTEDKIANLGLGLQDKQISWQQIDIEQGGLKLSGTMTNSALIPTPVVIDVGIQLATPQALQLSPLKIQISQQLSLNLDGFLLDLGSEVNIVELSLTPGRLICRGRLNVNP
ncbi:MAG: DUF2993 domain-containing protein [Symploca sp. SIO2B6]|nr:DUF2993 domain-containing protein [Symploca sp. SIO2B6]